jgi:hypothetical protein
MKSQASPTTRNVSTLVVVIVIGAPAGGPFPGECRGGVRLFLGVEEHDSSTG